MERQREKSSLVDQNYQKKWLKMLDEVDTLHVITIVCSFSNNHTQKLAKRHFNCLNHTVYPVFRRHNMNSWGLISCSDILPLAPSWPMGVSLSPSQQVRTHRCDSALKQWHHRSDCMSTREAEESEWETQIVISTSSRAKTSLGSGSVHLDNRLQVGFFYAL